MDLNDFGQSNYLAGADVGERGLLLTIKSITKKTVGKGAQAKEAVVLYFHETQTADGKPIKPMVCNKTNAKRIAQFTGVSRDVERNWVGVKIVAYYDPTVEFGGDIVGGIRVRPPKGQAQQQRPPIRQPQQVNTPVGYGDVEQGGGMDGDDYQPPDEY